MRVNPRFSTIALALATAAFAQPTAQPTGELDRTRCQAERAAIERDMDVARSKGQMLRRRQLAETLTALQARCEPLATQESREANIERLEQEIRELRNELDKVEAQLRDLKRAPP